MVGHCTSRGLGSVFSKVTFRSRCAAGSHHPRGFGEDCNGSFGLHRRRSRLADNFCGFYPHPAAWLHLSPLARPDGVADLSFENWLRSTLANGLLKVTLAVLERFAPGAVNNQWTSSTPTDLLPFERCQPALGEVTSPTDLETSDELCWCL